MDPGENRGGTPQPSANQRHRQPLDDELRHATAELCTYELPDGTRRLIAGRVGEQVHVWDRPVDHAGETYLVETQVSSLAELRALAADYRAQAHALGDCPMRAGAIDGGESSREREAIS